MEIVSRRTPRSKKRVEYETESADSKLRFYRYPPTGTLSLQEFENFALERLKGRPTGPRGYCRLQCWRCKQSFLDSTTMFLILSIMIRVTQLSRNAMVTHWHCDSDTGYSVSSRWHGPGKCQQWQCHHRGACLGGYKRWTNDGQLMDKRLESWVYRL